MVKHDNDNRPVVAARNNQPLRFLSVCSGIEAASVAWHPLGWQAVAFSEIEKFPSAVLAHHYPEVPNLGDFTKIDTKTIGRVDIFCGGTPCQAFSVAGLRQSLADERGNLSLEFVRLAHELADGNGLRNVVWENVPGVLSTKDNAFGCFLAGLVGADSAVIPSAKPDDGKSNRHWKWRKGGRYPILDDEGEPTGEFATVEPWHALTWPSHGMVSGPRGRAAWAVKDGQFFGVAQRRRRVIVVADFGIGADPAAVLFEPESLPRHSPPSREAGQKPAPTISARTKGGSGLGTDFDLDGSLVPSYAPEIARCDATREGSSQDYETTTMVAVTATLTATYGEQSGQDMMAEGLLHVTSVNGDVAHTLKAEGADASEDGTGRGTPIVAFNNTGQGWWNEAETAATVRKGDNNGNGGARESTLVAQTVAIRGREGGATAELGGEIATALRASQGGGDKPHVLAAVAIDCYNGAIDGDTTLTLRKGNGNELGGVPATLVQSAVRRLTPVECERLQGFPDGYTDIPWRGKPTSPDGPRYKALGNSWAVPKFAWLGRRIAAFMPALPVGAANDSDNKDTSLAA